MTRSTPNQSLSILLIAAAIFGIIAITFTLDYAFGQVQNVTSPPAPAPAQLEQVVEEVPAIAEQADTNTALTSTLIPIVGAVSAYIGGKTLKDKRDKEKVETYSSDTVKTVFNHVMDNYNDFANYCKVRREFLNLRAREDLAAKTDFELMNMIADPVIKKTYMQIEAETLDSIIAWNVEYYGSPSTDPNIVCPDPKNKIARTMTEIKKYSVPSTVKPSAETPP